MFWLWQFWFLYWLWIWFVPCFVLAASFVHGPCMCCKYLFTSSRGVTQFLLEEGFVFVFVVWKVREDIFCFLFSLVCQFSLTPVCFLFGTLALVHPDGFHGFTVLYISHHITIYHLNSLLFCVAHSWWAHIHSLVHLIYNPVPSNPGLSLTRIGWLSGIFNIIYCIISPCIL